MIMLYRILTGAGWTIAKGISFLGFRLYSNKCLALAATVSLRYTTVRRQGTNGIDSDGIENQVINYPSTYYRLLPILSRAFVFITLGRNLVSNTASSTTKNLEHTLTGERIQGHDVSTFRRGHVAPCRDAHFDFGTQSLGVHRGCYRYRDGEKKHGWAWIQRVCGVGKVICRFFAKCDVRRFRSLSG
jgi:hypothetical protein